MCFTSTIACPSVSKTLSTKLTYNHQDHQNQESGALAFQGLFSNVASNIGCLYLRICNICENKVKTYGLNEKSRPHGVLAIRLASLGLINLSSCTCGNQRNQPIAAN